MGRSLILKGLVLALVMAFTWLMLERSRNNDVADGSGNASKPTPTSKQSNDISAQTPSKDTL